MSDKVPYVIENHVQNGEVAINGIISGTKIDRLPSEILLQIFSYIESNHLLKNVRAVCKRFNDVLRDVNFWRKRCQMMNQKIDFLLNSYGLNDTRWRSGMEMTWSDVCYHIERFSRRWKGDNIQTQSKTEPHFACVDAIKLLNNGNYCVSGGRDRVLVLWDTRESLNKIAVNSTAHQGWIWDIESYDDSVFFTCDWNSTVRMWSLHHFVDPVLSFDVEKPAMALATTPGLVAVGLQTPKVCLLDPRIQSDHSIGSYKVHRQAITDLMMDDCYKIVSISEDKTLSVFDIRAYKLLLNVPVSSSFMPKCLSRHHNLIYVGNTRGGIHVVDSKRNYAVIKEFASGQTRQITSLWAGLSSVIVGCSDRTVRFLTPAKIPTLRSLYSCNGEVTSIDCYRNKLVFGRSDNCVSLVISDDSI